MAESCAPPVYLKPEVERRMLNRLNNPWQVSPPQIAAHLTRLTGYGATGIVDRAKATRRSGP